MITLIPTSQQIERAKTLYDFYNLKNSITHGKSQIYGAIGEILVMDFLKAEKKESYDYDLIFRGKTIEVKTKKVNSIPRENYNCSVSKHNTKQKCDVFIFVRVLTDFKKAWILGAISQSDFFRKAKYRDTTDLDIKADGYHLPIRELKCIGKYKA